MKMAILGAGHIAIKMANTIAALDGIEAYAVGSRDLPRARAFAQEHGFEQAYGSYEALVQDPKIDLVYIATPHSHHYEHAKLCLNNGKHVLCEKAFTVNAKQARELVALAQSKRLLLAEAIWTRYMPMRAIIDQLVASGIIGEITSLTANLGYEIDHVQRICEPALAGGALLDLSVYVLNFASMVLGDDVQEIKSTAVMNEKGVDMIDSITLLYKDGKMAVLYTTTKSNTDREGVINGRKGYIKMDNINNYERVRVFNKQHELLQTIEAPKQITGFEYQVLAAKRAWEAGEIECPEMPHAQIICMMEMMDTIRNQWGLVYPFE